MASWKINSYVSTLHLRNNAISDAEACPINFIHQIDDEDLTVRETHVNTYLFPAGAGWLSLHIGHTKTICLNFSLAKNY